MKLEIFAFCIVVCVLQVVAEITTINSVSSEATSTNSPTITAVPTTTARSPRNRRNVISDLWERFENRLVVTTDSIQSTNGTTTTDNQIPGTRRALSNDGGKLFGMPWTNNKLQKRSRRSVLVEHHTPDHPSAKLAKLARRSLDKLPILRTFLTHSAPQQTAFVAPVVAPQAVFPAPGSLLNPWGFQPQSSVVFVRPVDTISVTAAPVVKVETEKLVEKPIKIIIVKPETSSPQKYVKKPVYAPSYDVPKYVKKPVYAPSYNVPKYVKPMYKPPYIVPLIDPRDGTANATVASVASETAPTSSATTTHGTTSSTMASQTVAPTTTMPASDSSTMGKTATVTTTAVPVTTLTSSTKAKVTLSARAPPTVVVTNPPPTSVLTTKAPVLLKATPFSKTVPPSVTPVALTRLPASS